MGLLSRRSGRSAARAAAAGSTAHSWSSPRSARWWRAEPAT